MEYSSLELGRLCQKIRTQKEWSRKKLAEVIASRFGEESGLYDTIKCFENGSKKPTSKTLSLIFCALFDEGEQDLNDFLPNLLLDYFKRKQENE